VILAKQNYYDDVLLGLRDHVDWLVVASIVEARGISVFRAEEMSWDTGFI
jgi:hypothetical protein